MQNVLKRKNKQNIFCEIFARISVRYRYFHEILNFVVQNQIFFFLKNVLDHSGSFDIHIENYIFFFLFSKVRKKPYVGGGAKNVTDWSATFWFFLRLPHESHHIIKPCNHFFHHLFCDIHPFALVVIIPYLFPSVCGAL